MKYVQYFNFQEMKPFENSEHEDVYIFSGVKFIREKNCISTNEYFWHFHWNSERNHKSSNFI